MAVDDHLGGAFRGEVHIERIGEDARGSTASILVACGPDGFARESEKLEGGVLTTLVVEALGLRRREAADGTGSVSLASLHGWMWREIDDVEDYAPVRKEKPRLFASGGPTYYLDLPDHRRTLAPPKPALDPVSLALALESTEQAVCNDAIEALARSGPAAVAAVPTLSPLLELRNRSVRATAVVALGNCGAAAAAPLVKALADPDEDVRQRAVEALQRVGPAALPQLITALLANDEYIQLGAAAALGRIGPAVAEATPDLLRASVDSQHGPVRRAAAEALRQVGLAAAPKLVALAFGDQPPRVQLRAMEILEQFGPAAAPAFVAALGYQEEAARRGAVEALARMGSAAVPALVDAFANPDERVRGGAVEAFGGIEATDAAIPALSAALHHRDVFVRRSAVEALAALGHAATDAVAELAEALCEDRDEYVRVRAAEALAAMGPAAADAAPILVEALDRPGVHVKAAAARALGEIGVVAADAIPALTVALERSEPHILDAALYAARKIGSAAAPALITALRNPYRASTRCGAAEALAEIGSVAAGDAVPALILALGDPEEDVSTAAKAALQRLGDADVPALAAALQSKDVRIRRGVAAALGALGPAAAEALPALAPALADADADVGAAAAAALRTLGAAGVPALSAALNHKLPQMVRNVAEALAALGPVAAEASPVLLARLRKESKEVARLGALVAETSPALRARVRLATGNLELVCASALLAIGSYEAEAVLAVAVAISEGISETREAAIAALKQAGSRCVPALAALLGRADDQMMREIAAVALGKLGPAGGGATDALVAAFMTANGRVWTHAAWALGAIGPAAVGAVPAFLKFFQSPDAFTRESVIAVLGHVGPTPEPDTNGSKGDKDIRLRRDALRTVVGALADDDWWVRREAFTAIARFGAQARGCLPDNEEGAVLGLTLELGSADRQARRSTIDRLAALGSAAMPSVIGMLRGGTKEAREAAGQVLEKLGPTAGQVLEKAALDDLVDTLDDEDGDVRFRAVKALQSIGEAAVPALIHARDTGSPTRRHNAKVALHFMGKGPDPTA